MGNKPEARKGRSAADFLPEKLTLPALKEAAADCRGCDLYKNATQTVFGEGPRKAAVMLVGEVPGDQEDRQGRPFVGPAGRILADALAEVERRMIADALRRHSGNISRAARELGLTRRGLYLKLERHDLSASA